MLGCHFPPSENELFLTFGVQHLCFWRKGKENYLDRLDAITAVSIWDDAHPGNVRVRICQFLNLPNFTVSEI